jgi:hypothetical protein
MSVLDAVFVCVYSSVLRLVYLKGVDLLVSEG